MPLNDVVRGAAPCAASPICRFIVHASCQIKKKKRQETEDRQEQYETFHFVSLSSATVVVHYYFFRHPGVSISGGSQLHHQH